MLQLQEEPRSTLAFNLYKALSSNLGPTENLVFSPLSVATSLAKIALGTKQNTAEEIREALAYPDVEYAEDIADEMYELFNHLEDLKDAFDLVMSEGMFLDQDFTVLDRFERDVLSNDFSEVEQFERGKAGDSINNWFSESNCGYMELPFEINNDAQLVVTNVLSFGNLWDKPFDPVDTKEGDFTMANGETVQVPMMHQHNRFLQSYSKELKAIMIELPLLDREMSMFIFMDHFIEPQDGDDEEKEEEHPLQFKG